MWKAKKTCYHKSCNGIKKELRELYADSTEALNIISL